jgi:anti-sigma factor RsiW
MSARTITCRELIDFIADYLEHTLPRRDEEDFARHLAICASCRAYLATYEVTIRLGKAAYQSEAIEAAPDELIRAILDVHRRR